MAIRPAMVLLVCACAAIGAFSQTTEERTAAVNSLADAERAFARASVERGITPSFLEFFAPDGINFQPHPVNTRETLGNRPVPSAKPPITLNWSPVVADVSAAGDLGYTTGPYLLTDDRENGKLVGQGYYFSIWKKQTDGSWRVAVDYGIETPPLGKNPLAHAFVPAHALTPQPAAKTANPEAERDQLLLRDSDFLAAVNKLGHAKGYQRFTSWNDETRLLRAGNLPLVGPDAIRKFLQRQPASKWEEMRWSAIGGAVARSADMGYTYGSWQRDTGSTAEKGYYVRVWRRGRRGWVVVAEVMNPLPPNAR